MLETHTVDCPYCGAAFEALVDASEAGTDYIQDCEVCCQPIRFRLGLTDEGEVTLDVAAEQD